MEKGREGNLTCFTRADLRRFAKDVYDYLITPSDETETEGAEIIVAVGGPEIEAVVEKVFELWQEDPSRRILAFTSFGFFSDPMVIKEDTTEAETYKNALVAKGVPESNIVADPKAGTTTEEASMIADYVNGLESTPQKILLVDIPAHQLRCRLSVQYALKCLKISEVKLVNCPIPEIADFEYPEVILRLVVEVERLVSYLEMTQPPEISQEILKKAALLRKYLRENGYYYREYHHPRSLYYDDPTVAHNASMIRAEREKEWKKQEERERQESQGNI